MLGKVLLSSAQSKTQRFGGFVVEAQKDRNFGCPKDETKSLKAFVNK